MKLVGVKPGVKQGINGGGGKVGEKLGVLPEVAKLGVKAGVNGEDLPIGLDVTRVGAVAEAGVRGEARSKASKLKGVATWVEGTEVGGALNAGSFPRSDLASSSGPGIPRGAGVGATFKHETGNPVDIAFKRGRPVEAPSCPANRFASFPACGSFKEVALRKKEAPVQDFPRSSKYRAPTAWWGSTRSSTGGRKCARCLASDHRAASCRDPFRCRACFGTGHRASHCKKATMQGGQLLNRDRVRRGRPASVKAFVPFTEEFRRRTELRRNAMLVDVVQPADLGLAPQLTLANALARRFGGYAHDFFVTRYRERDFAVVLPGWVSADVLVRRQITTLDNIWIRCFPWGPYWNARAHRVRFTAWIQLRNVPFECWTVARVASMVSGFGRFISADEVSRDLSDLRAYRCRLAVDEIRDIPHRLFLVLGDEEFTIHVHLERWERVLDGGGGRSACAASERGQHRPR